MICVSLAIFGDDILIVAIGAPERVQFKLSEHSGTSNRESQPNVSSSDSKGRVRWCCVFYVSGGQHKDYPCFSLTPSDKTMPIESLVEAI